MNLNKRYPNFNGICSVAIDAPAAVTINRVKLKNQAKKFSSHPWRNTMQNTNRRSNHIDILNYLAIIALEKMGNYSPDQQQISLMENTLSLVLKNSLTQYQLTNSFT